MNGARGTRPSSLLSWIAVVVAVASLAVGVVALRRLEAMRQEIARAPVVEVAATGAAATPLDDRAAMAALVAGLGRRVSALEAAAAARAGTRGGEVARVDTGAAPPPASGPTPHFLTFEVPNRALRVRQTENGGISVSNGDPSLAGQLLRIKGTAEDGTIQELTIIVPPPEK